MASTESQEQHSLAAGADAFEEHYNAPVVRVSAAPLRAGAPPPEAYALGGCVLTPDTTLDPGWVVVEGNDIAYVGSDRPDGVRGIETGGVILPGLIDLHGHPNWNIFPAWEPPHLYPNRQAWRGSVEYREVISGPMSQLTQGWRDDRFMRLLARYGEIRALAGGSTAIQGDNSGPYTQGREPLVRHVDLAPFGRENAAALIDPLKPDKEWARQQVRQGIEDGSITAFYAHVAEGVDDESAAELVALADASLLAPATILIHGTALDKRQLGLVRESGAKLVWSPQSNLRLYGGTTSVAPARALGIPIAVAADWLPSGSVSLLDELQVARRSLAAQGDEIAPRDLVAMVTSQAAEIADLADHLGRLAVGRPADILVLEREHEDAYESVSRSGRDSVEMVVIGGRLVYGREDWFRELAPTARAFSAADPTASGESVWAWGKRMRLDLGSPADPIDGDEETPVPRHLAGIRAELLDRYRRIGPIFA